MQRLILVLAIMMPTCFSLAQAPPTLWTRTYFNNGSDYECRKAIETHDGNLAIVGSMRYSVSGTWNIFLMKLNLAGDTIWTREYFDQFDKTGYAIKETPDNGFIISGYSDEGGTRVNNAALIKTDSMGNLQWRRFYGGNNARLARSLTLAENGGYILAGYTDVVSRGEDIYVVKTDSLGIIEWSQNYGGQFDDRPWEIINTSDGGYALAGWSNNSAGLSQGYILKISSNGLEEWSNTFGDSASNEEARSILELPDGYIVGGDSCSSEGCRAALIKFDLGGERLWAHAINNQFMIYSVCLNSSGNIIAGGNDIFFYISFIAQSDTGGNIIWLRSFRDEFLSYCRSVIQTFDGSYIMAGNAQGYVNMRIYVKALEPDNNQDIGPANQLSQNYFLSPNYPNPFNAQTTIRYTLAVASNASIDIFDITGRKVETLLSEKQQAGEHSIVWNADGRPSGIYFYRLKAGELSNTEKCVLLK
jgi:hypothetical protein